jgi:hypothetical protein
MMGCIPDISTLLRIGHFYFALTAFEKSICNSRLLVVNTIQEQPEMSTPLAE